MANIQSTVNGNEVTVEIDGHEAAVDVIRDQLGLTGTKLVCAGGVCGACTIQVDGTPVASCLTPATALRDADVTTVEGLGGASLHSVQRAFMAHDGLQCGYCTPGFVVNAADFVDRWRAEHGDVAPDRHTVSDALAGHLCRCGAYEGIQRAIAAACRGEHDEPSTEPLRVDAEAKVTGAAIYTADLTLDAMLHGVIVRSPIAAGKVGAFAQGGEHEVVDLLNEDRRVRWAGQPIAALAADSLAEARRLAREFEVDIDPLPFVTDPDAASADGAPAVFENRGSRKFAANAAEGPISPARWSGNERSGAAFALPFMGRIAKRRVAKARSKGATGLVDLTVGTSPQLHTSFETHCTVADWTDPSRLMVWTSTQGVHHIAHLLAEHFGLDEEQVEAHADFIGGGFGSKLSLTVDQLAACELSRASGRPVSVVLDRREELTATGNRPGSSTDISMLVDDKGKLDAVVVDAKAHAGAAINGAYGMLAMLVYGKSPRIANDRDVITNAPPGTPFRGPGGPTYAWALEQAVDQAAHQTGRDPIALRQRWDGNDRRQALLAWASELDVWANRPATGSQTGRYRRGVGVAAANWLYMFEPKTEVVVAIEDGRLVVTNATQDMGTGSKTILARAVADVFGVAATEVEVRMGVGGAGQPQGPTSGGSRTTPSIHSAAVEAARKLHRATGGQVSAAHDGHSETAKRGGDRGRRVIPFSVDGLQIGRGFSSAVHVSEVEVDTLTGKTRVLTVHGGLGIGVPHARELAISQCEGSIIQGIGLALYENQILDPHTGLTLTSNLEDYRIPQLGDTPEISIHFHEEGWEHVPGGGVGLGEVATISPAASVANAVFNATGWRPTMAPIRPDRLLEGLR